MANVSEVAGTILDTIFKDPEVKHGLRTFSSTDLAKLNVFEEDGKIFIKCPVSDRK